MLARAIVTMLCVGAWQIRYSLYGGVAQSNMTIATASI